MLRELLFWAILAVLLVAALAWVFAAELARFYDDRRYGYGG